MRTNKTVFTFEHIYPSRKDAKYASLKDAQLAALPDLAKNIINVILELTKQGVLIKNEGKIIPNPENPYQYHPKQTTEEMLAISRKAHTDRKSYIVKPEIERFMGKVTVLENGCWFWGGGKTKAGYGHFWATVDGQKKSLMAHRFSYEYHVGKIENGLEIDHLCKNPSCVNPLHLEQVTPRENTLRSSRWKS